MTVENQFLNLCYGRETARVIFMHLFRGFRSELQTVRTAADIRLSYQIRRDIYKLWKSVEDIRCRYRAARAFTLIQRTRVFKEAFNVTRELRGFDKKHAYKITD